MKTNLNRPQQLAEIKEEEYSLDELMERLKVLTGEERPAAILRWLDVSASSWANWRRRGTIPYKALVPALLSKGYSLDWFFAPYQRLKIPAIEGSEIKEGVKQYAQKYHESLSSEEILTAVRQVNTILEYYSVIPTEQNQKLMLDIYFMGEGETLNKMDVMEQLAESFGHLESSAES